MYDLEDMDKGEDVLTVGRGARAQRSTNEQGNDKLRMNHIRLDLQRDVDPIIRIL